jgi:uncharacterized protein YndB with AHSA1/START domain
LLVRSPAMAPDTITREIVIDAPPRVVWAIVTEARHMAGWLVELGELQAYLAAQRGG